MIKLFNDIVVLMLHLFCYTQNPVAFGRYFIAFSFHVALFSLVSSLSGCLHYSQQQRFVITRNIISLVIFLFSSFLSCIYLYIDSISTQVISRHKATSTSVFRPALSILPPPLYIITVSAWATPSPSPWPLPLHYASLSLRHHRHHSAAYRESFVLKILFILSSLIISTWSSVITPYLIQWFPKIYGSIFSFYVSPHRRMVRCSEFLGRYCL